MILFCTFYLKLTVVACNKRLCNSVIHSVMRMLYLEECLPQIGYEYFFSWEFSISFFMTRRSDADNLRCSHHDWAGTDWDLHQMSSHSDVWREKLLPREYWQEWNVSGHCLPQWNNLDQIQALKKLTLTVLLQFQAAISRCVKSSSGWCCDEVWWLGVCQLWSLSHATPVCLGQH